MMCRRCFIIWGRQEAVDSRQKKDLIYRVALGFVSGAFLYRSLCLRVFVVKKINPGNGLSIPGGAASRLLFYQTTYSGFLQ